MLNISSKRFIYEKINYYQMTFLVLTGQNCQAAFGSKWINSDVFLQGSNNFTMLPIKLKPTDKLPLTEDLSNLAHVLSEHQTNEETQIYENKVKKFRETDKGIINRCSML